MSPLSVKSYQSAGIHDECTLIGFNASSPPFPTPPPSLVSYRYSSLQFYNSTPTLKGDGRCVWEESGNRGWKGLGSTPLGSGLSNDDGRATFTSVCREYLLSHALRSKDIPVVPVTNLFLLPCVSDAVVRDARYESSYQMHVGGVLERGTGSIWRLGQALTNSDYNIVCLHAHRHCECEKRCFFLSTASKLGNLAAKFSASGFVHGNLNSDNLSVEGLAFDLNVAGFMGQYDPDWVNSEVDADGIYRFSRQAEGIRWSLVTTAEILGGVDTAEVERTFDTAFVDEFERSWEIRLWGNAVKTRDEEEDRALYPRPHLLYRFLQHLLENKEDWEVGVWMVLEALEGGRKWEGDGELFKSILERGNATRIRMGLEAQLWDEEGAEKLCSKFDQEIVLTDLDSWPNLLPESSSVKQFHLDLNEFLSPDKKSSGGRQGSTKQQTCSLQ